jgi:beta-glucanase (GH16 family)
MYRGANHTFAVEGSTSGDWHVYGVVWTPEKITYLIDGYETRTIDRDWWNSGWYAANGHGKNAPFDQDFHLILNLALDSGQFKRANALESGADLPVYMEVEWVRAYTMEKDPWKTFGPLPDNRRRNF